MLGGQHYTLGKASKINDLNPYGSRMTGLGNSRNCFSICKEINNCEFIIGKAFQSIK
jgi:hypothetical protein